MILLALFDAGASAASASAQFDTYDAATASLGNLLQETHRPRGYELSPAQAEQHAMDLLDMSPCSVTLSTGDRLTIDGKED